ncbi:hypothetical protein Tco_0485341 [Tanacetum coccineum]
MKDQSKLTIVVELVKDYLWEAANDINPTKESFLSLAGMLIAGSEEVQMGFFRDLYVDYMVYHGKWVSCFMRERDGGKKDSNRLRAKKIGDERADIGKHMSGDSSQTVNVPINSLGPVSFATLSSYAKAMVELRVNVELKDTLVVDVPKFVGLDHILDECLKKIVSDVLKNLKTPRQAVRGVQNNVSSNGTKKQAGLTRQEASTSNPFDALNTVENDDELGTNGENSKLVEKGANSDVNDKLDRKLVLVDDDGKPLKPHVDPVNADSDSEVDEVFNETTETYNEDSHDDDFDDCDFIDAQMKFANKFDLSLCGQLAYPHVPQCLEPWRTSGFASASSTCPNVLNHGELSDLLQQATITPHDRAKQTASPVCFQSAKIQIHTQRQSLNPTEPEPHHVNSSIPRVKVNILLDPNGFVTPPILPNITSKPE